MYFSAMYRQWRNDGVAAASRDGGAPLVKGPPTVPQFLMINLNACVCCY